MRIRIIMTEQQYADLTGGLFPAGDDREHFGFALVGVSRSPANCNLLARKFILADESCLIAQSGVSVRPHPMFVEYVWTLAEKSLSGVIDCHTHPFSQDGVAFSSIDDADEEDGFAKKIARLGSGPHASMVLGRKSLDARWYDPRVKDFRPVDMVRILGQDLRTILPTSACRRAVIEETSSI